MELFNTAQLKFAYEYVQFTGQNIFLTGKAGTGKTTFLQNLKKVSNKRMIVVAPTGVAAINAGGVTIHSFFQLPFSPYIPSNYVDSSDNSVDKGRKWAMSKTKINIIRSLDLLVIDEISMVRADLLDQIDDVLRRYKNRAKPFGGVQLLMIGDIKQLAPIAKDNEWNLLRDYYPSVFFFHSKALEQTGFVGIELTHIFRQKDNKFISILNKIRDNKMTKADFDMLAERYIPNFRPDKDDGYITLTTHNYQSKEINVEELSEIEEDEHSFTAEITGNFPEYSYPTELELNLKVGAQVMFVKNDSSYEKLYYNGKIGKIISIDEDVIYVKCPKDEEKIAVTREEWSNVKYSIDADNKSIKEDIAGVFIQYPLKLAWAITIHKSQGLTFEKAIIDANAAFTHGQVYVALSRCKTMEGLILSSPLSNSSIISSSQVNIFTDKIENNQPTDNQLNLAKQEYELALLQDLFDFDPMLYKLYAAIKTARITNAAGNDSVEENISLIISKIKADISEFATKFRTQCKRLFEKNHSISNNNHLQERIIKASHYFYDKLEELSNNDINKLNFDTDNTTLAKLLDTLVGDLTKLIKEKLTCLHDSKNGFDALEYLNCRSKAKIETKKAIKKSQKKTDVFVNVDVTHKELYNRIKLWRNDTAEQEDKLHYMVIQLQSIQDISNLVPLTMKDLAKIRGIGTKKIKEYGEEILEIIRDYAKEKNISSSFEDSETVKLDLFEKKEKKTKTPETPTIVTTMELFKQGKNVAEIALERQLAESTVRGHLSKCILLGHLSVYDVVDSNKVKTAIEYFEQEEELFAAPVKEKLGEEYSYDELRCVISHLKYLKNNN